MSTAHDLFEPSRRVYNDAEPIRPIREPDESPIPSPSSVISKWSEGKKMNTEWWKYPLGIALLLMVVFLWTTGNFLASSVFADNTFSKPYFVSYFNTCFFAIPVIPLLLKQLYDERANPPTLKSLLRRKVGRYKLLKEEEDYFNRSSQEDDRLLASSAASLLANVEENVNGSQQLRRSTLAQLPESDAMTLGETLKLSFEFCILWFFANYFIAACFEFTTVASATILSSTSSIWTLIFGSMIGVEKFTMNKLLGVLASLGGVILISSVDVYGDSDKNRGKFPHKSPHELIIGDVFAFLSAVIYGIYTILMKKRIDDERRINMPLFFGLIGIINMVFLWPGFIVLHLIGHETFELPPTSRVTMILVLNALVSLVADFCWAYATLLTSPLVVTVGLGLTIPLSLVGQMVVNSQSSSALYWVGALVVFLSFIFINYQESKASEAPSNPSSEYDLIP